MFDCWALQNPCTTVRASADARNRDGVSTSETRYEERSEMIRTTGRGVWLRSRPTTSSSTGTGTASPTARRIPTTGLRRRARGSLLVGDTRVADREDEVTDGKPLTDSDLDGRDGDPLLFQSLRSSSH
ncbi:hypothetical protein C490_17634 [Natronobacterium gregoryi SP2]|uniref:Uncharacterized protein n=1 Tax=Natronobacterium gregoryi (strain ATCC 43098 / DSM 3393 / CCM 3738 / CIP 104747 / IAM 13177 / JCM 8860 / NBRC 102187 / NCIMB 2189 / SP2) TaxID=797304 RepID=L9XPY1_NATGS|nr:hypothetical protein C490_17634 [Natronobacterium gregoryi SP2]